MLYSPHWQVFTAIFAVNIDCNRRKVAVWQIGPMIQKRVPGSVVEGGQAQAMTKGEISLALAGSGRGWDVGVSIGGFTITKKE
jgi:hypothetical protein